MLPNDRPLSDEDIRKFGSKYIPHFRGVFMRDTLPNKARKIECAVINLDSVHSIGTHWVAYKKQNNIVHYFDSFGSLPPPKEVQQYFNGCEIYYNYNKYQSFDSFNCGNLCIDFLLHHKIKAS